MAAKKKFVPFRPGPVALEKIRRFQRGTGPILRKVPFQRLVKRIAQNVARPFRFESSSVFILHEACEAHLVRLFADAKLCALHAKRTTITKRDLALARRFSGMGTF